MKVAAFSFFHTLTVFWAAQQTPRLTGHWIFKPCDQTSSSSCLPAVSVCAAQPTEASEWLQHHSAVGISTQAQMPETKIQQFKSYFFVNYFLCLFKAGEQRGMFSHRWQNFNSRCCCSIDWFILFHPKTGSRRPPFMCGCIVVVLPDGEC